MRRTCFCVQIAAAMNFISPRSLVAQPSDLADVDNALLRSLARHSDDDDFWSSKSRDRADSAHCIFQYPAMMVPVVQRRLLKILMDAQPAIRSLYDPFVGSGTSLVSGMHFGLSVYGNDVNPLAVLISRVRTARKVEFTIGAIAKHVGLMALRDRKTRIETTLVNRDKWFKADVADELSRLRRAIRKQEDLWVRRFLWTILAETVRLTSNDRTSTYKLHARPAAEIASRHLSPIQIFDELSLQGADSFFEFRSALRKREVLLNGRYREDSRVLLADTRDQRHEDWSREAPFDLLMTSPPYGDNRTTVPYGQHAYLPLHWIDLHDIDQHVDVGTIRTTHEIDRRSLGGQPCLAKQEQEALFTDSPTLSAFASALPSTPADGRDRLFRFYLDFHKSLRAIVHLMRANGYMIWTVGNRSIGGRQVPTDAVLTELLLGMGCRTVDTLTRTIHHKRMPGRNATSATMREERILIVRKCSSGL